MVTPGALTVAEGGQNAFTVKLGTAPTSDVTVTISKNGGGDADLSATMARLVEQSPLSADDIAAAVVAGLDRGDELIVPDEPARAACSRKLTDRRAYDAQMRGIASRMKERGA